MAKDVKVLYDSSVLISAFLKEKQIHKTGIFRYVENLATHLNQYPDIDLNFYSSLDSIESQLWKNKLLQLSHLKNIPLVNVSHPLKDKMLKISTKLKASKGLKSIFLKSYREGLRAYLNKSHFEDHLLKPYDLFYSPYHPAPKALREQKQLKCITTIHDLIPLKYPKFFKVDKKPFFDRILKNPKPWHYFFALSESTKADMCHYYSIDPSKIFIVHSAPTEGLFYPHQDFQKATEILSKYKISGRYFLSLATLEPRKNITMLVDAFIQLVSQNPKMDVKLVLCGVKGWGFEALLKKVEKHKDRIIITGFVEDCDLAAIYSNALAFVCPSLYEGFGLPPLEAMSCGSPVIVSDRSSLPEVVGSAGLYVDPTNIDDICHRLNQVYEDEALVKILKNRSLAQAKKFNWENNALKAHKAIKQIIR